MARLAMVAVVLVAAVLGSGLGWVYLSLQSERQQVQRHERDVVRHERLLTHIAAMLKTQGKLNTQLISSQKTTYDALEFLLRPSRSRALAVHR